MNTITHVLSFYIAFQRVSIIIDIGTHFNSGTFPQANGIWEIWVSPSFFGVYLDKLQFVPNTFNQMVKAKSWMNVQSPFQETWRHTSNPSRSWSPQNLAVWPTCPFVQDLLHRSYCIRLIIRSQWHSVVAKESAHRGKEGIFLFLYGITVNFSLWQGNSLQTNEHINKFLGCDLSYDV